MSAVVLSELLCGPVLKFTHTQMRPRDRAAEEPAVSEDLSPASGGRSARGRWSRVRGLPGTVTGNRRGGVWRSHGGGVRVCWATVACSFSQAIEERRIQNWKAAAHLLMRESDREIPTGR